MPPISPVPSPSSGGVPAIPTKPSFPKCEYYLCKRDAKYLLAHRAGNVEKEFVCDVHEAVSRLGGDERYRFKEDGTLFPG